MVAAVEIIRDEHGDLFRVEGEDCRRFVATDLLIFPVRGTKLCLLSAIINKVCAMEFSELEVSVSHTNEPGLGYLLLSFSIVVKHVDDDYLEWYLKLKKRMERVECVETCSGNSML